MSSSWFRDKKNNFWNFLKEQRWAILAGVFMGTSYIPFPPWAVAFCFTPLYWDLLRKPHSLREVFIKAWVTQFVFTLIGFYWIAYVSHEFGFLPWPVALFVLLLFAAGMHLHIPMAAVLAQMIIQKCNSSKVAGYFVFALLFALADQLWPGMFPFHIGYTALWAELPIAQWADVAGFLGLGLFLHLTQASIGALTESPTWRQRLPLLVALIALHAILNWTGLQRMEKWNNPPDSIRVLQVQANIGNIEKLYAEKGRGFQKEITDRYFNLTTDAVARNQDEGGKPIDLVIWPESAYPDFLDDHNSYRLYTQRFLAYQKSLGLSILTGAYSSTGPGEGPRKEFNALFLYDGEKGLENPPYRKTHLLAFGEFVPFGETFPILKKWNPGGEGFSRGKGPMTLSWRGHKVGVQICYESLYPEFSAALVQQGADFLVNLTNDSWFGPTSEPYQHLYMTLARAIETRRPLIRNTNTGITTAIEANGQIHEKSPIYSIWTNVFDIGIFPDAPPTFHSRWGHLLPFFTLALLAFVIIIGPRKEKS